MGGSDFALLGKEDLGISKKQISALAGLDCKGVALGLAHADNSLRVRRGFAVFRQGYTEHWWCETRTGIIVDPTPLRSMIDGVPDYRPLPSVTPMVSLCDVYEGPCEQKPKCVWCVARDRLIRSGLTRMRLVGLRHRVIYDKLFAENYALRAALSEELIEKDGDRMSCRKCSYYSTYSSELFWADKGSPRGFPPIEHADYCILS